MKLRIKIDGLAELNRKLMALPQAIRGRPLRAAVAAGARVVQKEARAQVPVDSGLVRDRIRTMSVRQEQQQSRAEVVAGVRRSKRVVKQQAGNSGKKDDPYYWKFIEFGTRFQPARPFLRTAFATTREEAAATIRDRLAKRVMIEAEKLGRQ